MNWLKKPTLWRWIGGIFCIIFALAYIDKNVLSSIGFAFASIILLPPLSNIPSLLLKKPVSRGVKIILLVIFLTLGFKYAPQNSNNINNKVLLISPTKKIVTPTTSTTPTPIKILYEVTSVVDGDTFKVKINGKIETVRLIGIDTPETVDPRKSVQCFGIEALNKAKQVLSDKKVRLESDSTQGDKDKYDRLLRYAFLEDEINFNKMMILEGYAHEYTYDTPYKYQKEFKEAELIASENKKGLWADDICVTPTPTYKPISAPIPTQEIYVPPPTEAPQTQINQTGSYSCDCSKSCSQMASCEEAYYQLNNCSCSARDGDKDGVPCESVCPGG